MMDKVSNEDKMRSKTLREKGFGVKTMTKHWSSSRCRRSVVGLIRRVQLWCVVQVAIDRSLCCCSWWTFWTLCLNPEWATDIHHWNVWTVDEKLCKVLFVIREYSMRNCMFTWKRWTL